MTNSVLRGKPYAGNPHVRFDEGEVASAATPRLGSLPYKRRIVATVAFTAAAVTLATAPLALASETTDFWDTSERAADVTSSVTSSGSAAAYFETEHESSFEVSIGSDINTFPLRGLRFIFR